MSQGLMSLGLSALLVFIIAVLILVFITQLIWNAVLPDVFGCKQIGFWQTFGLLVLANIFFGGHCNASNMNYVM